MALMLLVPVVATLVAKVLWRPDSLAEATTTRLIIASVLTAVVVAVVSVKRVRSLLVVAVVASPAGSEVIGLHFKQKIIIKLRATCSRNI